MRFKNWVKKYAKEILIGVIVSVITTFIIKGMDWIKEIAPTAGHSVWRFFLNTFYSSAAKMTETSLITFIFSALLGGAVAYIYNLVSSALGTTKEAIQTTTDILNDTDCEQKSQTQREQPKITKAEIKSEAKDLIKTAKKVRITMIIAFCFFVLYFGHITLFKLLPHSLWSEYQRDLLKIAPYIEQQELIEIKSDWACMQTKEDYDEIYKKINEVKSQHNLP